MNKAGGQFETLPANPLGWFLALVGVGYMRTPDLHCIGSGVFRYSVRIDPQFAGLTCQAGAFLPLDVGGF
jgi:hypothetical protein